MSEHFGKVNVLGVDISVVRKVDIHRFIQSAIDGSRHDLVLNANAHCLNLAYKRPWLQEFLNSAPIVFADGFGVILAARILGYILPERITYADWIWDLCEEWEGKGYGLFFLGAKRGVAEQAASILKQRFLRLNVRGCQHGYFDKSEDSAENSAVIDRINSSQVDILIVGFGMPLQEKWLRDNYSKLNVNIALTGGAVFDYVSGKLRRGPAWMTDHGLEWLSRLIIEPQRLWSRYVIGNPLFIYRVLKQRFGSAYRTYNVGE